MTYILIFIAWVVIANILGRVLLRNNNASADYVEPDSDDANEIKYIAVRGPDTEDAYGRLYNHVPFEDPDEY